MPTPRSGVGGRRGDRRSVRRWMDRPVSWPVRGDGEAYDPVQPMDDQRTDATVAGISPSGVVNGVMYAIGGVAGGPVGTTGSVTNMTLEGALRPTTLNVQ